MENLEIEINGKMFPANLDLVFKTNSEKDYVPKYVYYLESENEEGSFPAIILGVEPKRIVLTTDKDLIKKVLDTLLLRKTKIRASQFFVHKDKEYPIGYSLINLTTGSGTESTPYQLLTEDEFTVLKAKDLFKWSRNDMSKNPLFGLKVAVEKV